MSNRWWGLAFAGLACSGGTTPAADGGSPILDAGSPPSLDAPAPAVDLERDVGPDAAEPDALAMDAVSADAASLSDSVLGAALSIDMDAFIFSPTPFQCESATAALLTVTNVGGSASAALRVGLEGAYPDRFRVAKDGCSGQALPPEGTCGVEVRFVPKQVMELAAMADLVVQGTTGERAQTSLLGEAREDDIQVFPLGAGLLDFETVKVGATSPILEQTWNNDTDLPAIPGPAVLAGSAAADFTVATNTCSGVTVAPRQTCRLGVRLKPTVSGQRLASLTMGATAACGYDFSDTLTLVGVGE
jgi:hypothetical protein